MSSGTSGERWRPSLRTIAPVLVFAGVVLARILVGFVSGWTPHPITFVGAAAGTLGATLVHHVGRDVYEHTTAPTTRLTRHLLPDDHAPAASNWLVLVAGALAGGIYPTVAIGVLGLPGSAVTTLLPGLAIALLWTIVLALTSLLIHLAARTLTDREAIRIHLEFHLIFAIVFAPFFGLTNILWYPLLGL